MRPLAWALALAWASLPLAALSQDNTASAWDAPPLKASGLLQETLSQETRDQAPTHVRGDHITGQADVRAEVEGNAELRQIDTVIRADRVEYTVADDWVDAQGHVHINRSGDVYQGSTLKMHVEAFKGVFTDASYRFLATGAHGDASQVDFLDRDRSRVHQATYTTCERDNEASWQPDWILRAQRIELDQAEQVGVAHDAVLEFKGVPILPVPTISFPLSTQRKSGLLPPTIGIDSRSGLEYSQPYYWNIAPNRDATITPVLRSKRGLGLDGEFRYLEPQYKGALQLSLLPNDTLRDRDRWAYHWSQTSSFNTPIGGLGLYWNLNRVSDDNYWRDFSRYPGQTTGTGVTRLLANDAVLGWGYGDHSVTLTVQKWQALQDVDSPITPPFDRMPSLFWRYAPFNFGNGLDVVMAADTTRFERASIWNTVYTPNGQRSYAMAQVSKSFLTPGSFLTPKLQLHSTHYQLDGSSTSYTRSLPTFSLDSGLVFERDTRIWGSNYLQTLEPRAFYTYTPYRNQSMLPVYDSARSDFNFASIFGENSYVGQDRIADNNLLTLGLTTRFIDPDTGSERARFGVAQRVRFSDQQVTLPGETVAAKGLSDVLVGAGFNASDRWAFDSTVQYNRDTERIQRSTVTARYMPGPYKTLSTAYRFQRDSSEQIDVGWQWPLFNQEKAKDMQGGRWYTVGRLNYSLQDNKLVDTVLGFEYDSCCWIGRVVLQRLQTGLSQANTQLLFQIEFVGFSRLSLGSDPLRSLKTQVPRYRELRDQVVTPSRFSNYD